MRCRRTLVLLTATTVTIAACSGGSSGVNDASPTADPTATTTTESVPTGGSFPPAPDVPDGALDADAAATFDGIASTLELGLQGRDLRPVVAAGDPRAAWYLSDLLRFAAPGDPVTDVYIDAAEMLTGAQVDRSTPWRSLTDHLIAWDLPAYPGYDEHKALLFTTVDPRWSFVFDDPDADLDYRILNWGGVLIDDRPLGDTQPCVRGCIPSLDDPVTTDAAGGGWYPDDAVVFGVVIDGEAVAFPKNIMEVHEMVNATLGGRRFAMPYCTLCGSAQVFFTDEVDGVDRPPVLRTSGLLSRSNKVMYDLDSQSVFNTFTGEAVTGPLREAGVVLPQATVVTTTWADWKQSHPDTQIIAEDGGIGRSYDLDPLGGRDDNGPIFPIGEVDDRLGVQDSVVGVLVPDGTPVAFDADAARSVLQDGGEVTQAGVSIELDGAGLIATFDGEPIASHQSFWFAWSQFHPDTALWRA